MKIDILVATITGTAELVADEIQYVLEEKGVEAAVRPMDDLTPAVVEEADAQRGKPASQLTGQQVAGQTAAHDGDVELPGLAHRMPPLTEGSLPCGIMVAT